MTTNSSPDVSVDISFKKLHKLAQEPEYKTNGSSGADLRACLDSELVINPGESMLVPTGISIEMESGCEAQIRSRSGLSAKNCVTVLNSPGTIDSDYRGELKVILFNFGKESFVVEHGMRVAQIVFAQVLRARFGEVESIGDTQRGEGGFGSTGL